MQVLKEFGRKEYEDVAYMTKNQYNSLFKYKRKIFSDNNLATFLLSSKEEHSNLYNFKMELIDIINGCFKYNVYNRISLEEILNRLEYLNNNISSEFQSKLQTIRTNEDSENNQYNFINEKRYMKDIQYIESEEASDDINVFNKSEDEEEESSKEEYNVNNVNQNKIKYNSNKSDIIGSTIITIDKDVDKRKNNNFKTYNFNSKENNEIEEKELKRKSNGIKEKIDTKEIKKFKGVNKKDEYKELHKSKLFFL